MQKRLWLSIVLVVLIVPAMLFTTSCAKKAVTGTSASKMAQDEAARQAAEKAKQEELARKHALEEQRLKEQAAQKAQEARQQFENAMVHFAFDSSELDATAQDILRQKAAWLRANPDANIIIQGNCDERGTVEYNLALGDRRARSAKEFLKNLGIAASRMTTISYGEERPLDPAHNEQAWAKNRRDQFVIK